MIGLAALAMASGANAGVMLWNNIEAGMTVDQVHALYPLNGKAVEWHDKVTELHDALRVGNCRTRVGIWHRHGVVEEVYISPDMNKVFKVACTEEAFQAMLTKYGPAEDQAGDFRPHTLRWTPRSESKITNTWVRDGVVITMTRIRGGFVGESWNINYKPATDSGL